MPINARLPFFRQQLFSLRTILLFVMLMVLGLPLIGLYFFRIYENELVQQTELELIAQSAALSASFKSQVRVVHTGAIPYGRALPTLEASMDANKTIVPTLSLINSVQPPRPNAQSTMIPIDSVAETIGRHMAPIMQDTQQITLSGMRLLDVNGTVIAGREETGWSLAHIPEVQMALKGQYASAIRQRISDEPPPPLYSLSRGTHIRVFIAFPIIEKKHLQGVLYLSRTPNNILKHLFEVKNKVFTVSFGLLVLVVLLVLFVSATISRPIRELIEQTESVKKGRLKFTEPLKYPVTYEIARLSESFATMSKALALRTDYIQRFATHVSHEFKTPLSSMQGTLELLQDHLETMPEDQRQHFLNNLLSDTQRLKILVNRLLELARADVLEPAPLNACLTEMLEKLKDNFNDRGLAVNFSNTEVYWLSIAPDALEIILLNLLENSLQHGASQVDVKTSLKDRVLEIYLQDNGSGISFANRNKIFTAFFTTRRNTGGTGLGLEIVSSLLKAFDGNIKLLESEHGALFLLTLSLATRTH